MPRIKCASIDCKWNSDSNMCTYGRTGHTMLLCDSYVMTVHDGRQHFHRCKAYEQSDWAKELESKFKNFLDKKISELEGEKR